MSQVNYKHVRDTPKVLVKYIQDFNSDMIDEAKVDQFIFPVYTDEINTMILFTDEGEIYYIETVVFKKILRHFAGIDTTRLRNLSIQYLKPTETALTDEYFIVDLKFKL